MAATAYTSSRNARIGTERPKDVVEAAEAGRDRSRSPRWPDAPDGRHDRARHDIPDADATGGTNR